MQRRTDLGHFGYAGSHGNYREATVHLHGGGEIRAGDLIGRTITYVASGTPIGGPCLVTERNLAAFLKTILDLRLRVRIDE